MRWTPKIASEQFGRYRDILRFAWYPRKLHGTWVWLERYVVAQRRQQVPRLFMRYWLETKPAWVDLWELPWDGRPLATHDQAPTTQPTTTPITDGY